MCERDVLGLFALGEMFLISLREPRFADWLHFTLTIRKMEGKLITNNIIAQCF